jgi:hypothetical protein
MEKSEVIAARRKERDGLKPLFKTLRIFSRKNAPTQKKSPLILARNFLSLAVPETLLRRLFL